MRRIVIGWKYTQQQFRILFETAPDGAIAVNAVGNIVLLNQQAAKIFGYAREELIGQPVEALIPERFRRGHADLRKSFVAASRMRSLGEKLDLCAVRKDGSEFPVEVGLNPVPMSTGRVVIATVVDVTERKRVEEQKKLLEHAQAKMEICQQLGMPAAVLQHDGRVLLVNPLLKNLRAQFVIVDDRIKLSDAVSNRLFLQAVACLSAESADQIVHSIPIHAEDHYPPLFFQLLPMKGSLGGMLGILVVTTLGALAAPAADMLQGLFGLAPAEARVAALIGSGRSPRGAANQLGISEETARTTLKHVFGKIGVRRQSELAVLLSRLALR